MKSSFSTLRRELKASHSLTQSPRDRIEEMAAPVSTGGGDPPAWSGLSAGSPPAPRLGCATRYRVFFPLAGSSVPLPQP